MSETSPPEMEGFAICVPGRGFVAWFASADDAENFGREFYFGQWLMSPYSIPRKPLFTKEQIEEAEHRAAELSELFNTDSKIAD